MHSVLENVHRGMKVFDNARHEIGTVEWVKLSDEDPATPGPETVDVSDIERDRNHSLLSDIAEAFAPDEVPDVVRDRLLREGFVRMDADGLFAADRYIMPDQIDAVAGDEVTLKVSRQDLMKRPWAARD